MVSCSVSAGTVVPPSAEWTAGTPAEMRASMTQAVKDWHPGPRGSSAHQLDSIFMIPFGFLEPADTWEPSRVTLVGDATHAMLPTLGMGANLALRDAASLAEKARRRHRHRDRHRGI